MQLLMETGRKVNVRSVVDVCRDPDDNYLLALAKDGGADYLLTGDADLLTLKEFGKTKIMQLTDFIKLIKKRYKNYYKTI
jgi:predicted nucleic acid-binding protein